MEDTTNNRVLRLNLNAHPLGYINDQDQGTAWISHSLPPDQHQDQGINITIDLLNGQYQVPTHSHSHTHTHKITLHLDHGVFISVERSMRTHTHIYTCKNTNACSV